ncbi:unnamed protein product, partial [Boreogadus saida]
MTIKMADLEPCFKWEPPSDVLKASKKDIGQYNPNPLRAPIRKLNRWKRAAVIQPRWSEGVCGRKPCEVMEELNHANVKVAVRLRPMNRREREMKTKCVVEMNGNQTLLHPANLNLSKDDPRTQPKVFAYDHCFWSMDESQTDVYAGQDKVFQCLGDSLLDNAFLGYNACIFAYGQTGSGKSYTMMGSAEQPGLIPRLCCSLFARTLAEQREGEVFTVEVSYLEIYNERVRDLLDPKG